MKKRKILYFLPVFSLLLTGCDFASIMDKAKDLGGKIVNPIKDLINPDKEGDNGEGGGNQEGEGGNEEGGGGEEQQVVAVSIKELIGVPAEIVQGETLAASSLKATVIYSDNSSKTEDVTKVELDTSKVGLATGKAYVNTLVKEFTINVKAKEEHHEEEDKPTHAGTMEDPYTGADAVIVANGLEDGGKTPESYYIKGKVTEFRENFSSQYGNYSFAIEGGFVCWRLMKQGNVAFNEGDIEIGDEVLVYAQIMKYVKGEETTLETSGGYVVSVHKEGKAEITGVSGIASMPESLEVNDVLKPADVMLTVTLSDGTTDVVAATEVSCDTSVPGEATVTASYLAFAPVTGTITVNAPEAKIPGDFYKVKTQDEIEAGTYLIVYDDAKAFSGVDAANGFVEINAEKGHVAANESLVKVEAEEMEGGFSLKVLDGANAGKYMYGTSGNNGLKFGESPVLHTFEHTEEGNDRIVCDSTFFSFNKSDGQMRFRYYKSENQQPVSLYKMEPTAPAELESISIEGELGKVSYFEGESYITQGLSVLAHYSDGSSKEVEAAITLDKDIAAVGDTAVLASAEFEGKTVNLSFDVTVVAVELVSITADITNKLYTVDDELSLEGLVVTGTYNNETTADLTASAQTSLEAGHILTADDTSLVVSVGEVQTTISLTINPKQEEGAELVSIAITSELHREFNVGEEFVGEEVTASYTKGEPRVVQATFSGYDMSVAGSQTVTASYTEGEITKEATYSIEVKALPELASIEVTNAPDKVEYVVGETFDPTGMVVQANYTAGKASAVITGYTFSTDALTASDESIELSYTEDGVTKTTTVSITVTAPAPKVEEKTYLINVTVDGVTYYMQENGTNAPKAVTDPDEATPFIFTLVEGTSDHYKITTKDGNYLYCTADNNGVKVGKTEFVWIIEDGESTLDGAYNIYQTSALKSGETARYLTLYNASDFRSYNSATAGNRKANTDLEVYYEKTLDSIIVDSEPAKKAYYVGDTLDVDGLVVKAHYVWEGDGSEYVEISDYSLSVSGPFTAEDIGTKVITVSYGEKTATFEVTVEARVATLTSITIDGEPESTTYNEGDEYSAAGLTVTAHYSDESTSDITAGVTITIDKTIAAVGDTSIKYSVEYEQLSATKDVNVTVNEVVRASLPHTASFSFADGSAVYTDGWSGTGESYYSTVYSFKAANEYVMAEKLFDELSSIKVAVKSIVNSASADTGRVTIYALNDAGEIVASDVIAPDHASVSNAAAALSAATEKSVTLTGTGITGVKVAYTTKSANLALFSVEVRDGSAQAVVESVSLDKTTLSMEEGSADVQLTATTSPSDVVAQSISWSSDNPSVATVTDGKVHAVAGGTATITVTADGKTATCVVTVLPDTSSVAAIDCTAAISDSNVSTSGVSKKTGYYQDGGTAGETVNSFTYKSSSALWSSEPLATVFVAKIGGGSAKSKLDAFVYVVLLDADGNEINGTTVMVTDAVNTAGGEEFKVVLPNVASAYGFKVTHVKESGWNARYYSFDLQIAAAK